MSAPLPFSDLLDELRKRGFDIGLAQYQDVARLCEQFGAELAQDRRLLARSLAGLLARNRDEKNKIEQLFFQHFAPALAGDAVLVKEQPEAVLKGLAGQEVVNQQQAQQQQTMWKRWRLVLVSILVLLALIGGGAFVAWKLKKPPAQLPAAPTAPAPPTGTAPPPPPQQIIQSLPELGDGIYVFHWQQVAWVVLPIPFLLFGILYSFQRKRGLRSWAKRHWRAVRNAAGGTIEPEIDFAKLLPPALARSDLDDMATILGRSDDRPPSRELDGEKSVLATLMRGALPTLVFEQQRLARTVLVLCDVSSDMRLWRRKCDALCDGLKSRGVPLVVRYFDGDASSLAERPFGPPQALLQLQLQYPDAALLILSTGSGIYDRQELRQLAPWLLLCSRFPLRVWLHPVLSHHRWRRQLSHKDFPLRVLPMSRNGLLAAAYDLAQEPERRRHIADAAASSQRAATQDDLQQLKRLLPMWPEAPPELAEYLLHKFCPGLPEETLLRVWATSQDLSGQRLRFASSDLSRWLTELQDSEKHLQSDAEIQQRIEERVRRELLRILRLHEPTRENPTEHMQWRLRCALQQLFLHDPDDRNVNEALAALRELGQGALWEGVAEAMASVGVPLNKAPGGKPTRTLAAPVRQKLQKEVLSLIRATANGKVVVPSGHKGKQLGNLPQRPGFWHLPSLWEFGPALLLMILCGLWAHQKGVGKETIENVEAYQIERSGSAESAQVELSITSQREGSPSEVTLCADAACTTQHSTLRLGIEGVRQSVARQKEDRYYHVRARLPRGAWAYSKQVLIPGYVPPPMGELLVHFVSEGRPVLGVIFAVTDATGKEQPGQAEKRQSLRAGPVQIVGSHQPYPPFAQASEVKAKALQEVTIDLGEPPAPPGMVKIPAGSFAMGSNDGQDDEKPVHRVTLPTYYIDQLEVTMEQYQACVKASGCSGLAKTVKYEGYTEEQVKTYSQFCNVNLRGKAQHPVNCVDWNQAAAYCKWAGKRLPTEQEWEYAARGKEGRKYPWGSEAPRAGLLNACGSECVAMAKKKGLNWSSMYSGDDGWETTAPVGSIKGDKTSLGVMDLGGNVTEWVQDLYRSTYAKAADPTNLRSLRGASWDFYDPTLARAPLRNRNSPVIRFIDVGFRCARTKLVGPPN